MSCYTYPIKSVHDAEQVTVRVDRFKSCSLGGDGRDQTVEQ